VPSLANPRHEVFAHARSEGLGQYDAYISAGFEGNPSAASQLEKRPEVRQRIQELVLERQTARMDSQRTTDDSVSDLNRDWILRELKENIRQAQSAGQISAANKAIEMLIDLLNLVPKKGVSQQEEDTKTPVPPSDDNLHRALDKINKMANFAEEEDFSS